VYSIPSSPLAVVPKSNPVFVPDSENAGQGFPAVFISSLFIISVCLYFLFKFCHNRFQAF